MVEHRRSVCPLDCPDRCSLDVVVDHGRVVALDGSRANPMTEGNVYDCNPVATVPDQARVVRALARDDLFTVVQEQVHTDTVDDADVVLPATTFLEHHELVRSYGGYLVQWAEPAASPVGESRSNHAVPRSPMPWRGPSAA